MFTAKAKLAYYNTTLIAYADKSLGDYYRNLIPKAKQVQPQKYPAHVTVVRMYPIEFNAMVKLRYWNRYEGDTISFTYDGVIRFHAPYYFIKVWSNDIGRIRMELGLPQYRDGFDCYHISIGNVK